MLFAQSSADTERTGFDALYELQIGGNAKDLLGCWN